MSRPDRQNSKVVYPNPSLPAELVALYREHGHRLPTLSAACADGMRAELVKIGVEPPAPTSAPKRTAKAVDTAVKNRTASR